MIAFWSYCTFRFVVKVPKFSKLGEQMFAQPVILRVKEEYETESIGAACAGNE